MATEKVEFEGVLERVGSFQRAPYSQRYVHWRQKYLETCYVYTFRSQEGAAFVWFSTCKVCDPTAATNFNDVAKAGSRVKVKGGVKERKEYKGELQTVLTRCKVEVLSVAQAA